MKIEQHIAQLLYRYQCVTVPGFGAFLTEIQSAQLHLASHSFYPPKKNISFNSFLKNNDGLLANHIALIEKMSYDVAVSCIQREVQSWKEKLELEGALQLKNIGVFSLNAEHNLVFVPTDQVNYLTSSFGLTTYSSPSIVRESVEETQEQQEEIPVVHLDTEKSIGNPFIKYASIFLIASGLLGASGYFGNQYYQQQLQQETLAVQTKVQKQVEKKIQEATFFIQNPLPTVTLTLSESKRPYHIVAGSFLEEQNADRMYEELLKLGYQAKKIRQNKHGLYPVIYGSFASYTEAQNELDKIKKSHNPEAWLLIEELQ
ncbi:HU domain-containing protein [Flavobacterium aciduliphilum]|uniref:Sporulation related protein n=1 Tax=Flavobacterium aciduliphilum TaxID=1101402 RepID=A0A328YL34_9FLAO|nr:SPOR domain-containing protein [Flavobacterium aciduliphilum]RAR72822.1 sporulation related protein [Flavobacterium aciduliphilum]